MDSLNSLIEVLSFFVLNRLIWYKKSQFLCAYALLGAENERFFLRSTPYLFVLGNTLLWEQWERARQGLRAASR